MAKPSDLPVWNETEERVTQPDVTRQQTGFVWSGTKFEKPKGEHFNWWMNNVYKWVNWFNDNVVDLSNNQTIAGVKTFSSFPVTPSSAPTTDYQVANKKFVLDNGINFDEIAYDDDTLSFITNTLSSGGIIETGSNANGEYVKFIDGTMICLLQDTSLSTTVSGSRSFGGGTIYYQDYIWTYPAVFISTPLITASFKQNDKAMMISCQTDTVSTSSVALTINSLFAFSSYSLLRKNLLAIGRWK